MINQDVRCVFPPKFSKYMRYFSQKNINYHVIFHQFFDVKMGDNPNNQTSSVNWLLMNPNVLKLAVLGKANFIF